MKRMFLLLLIMMVMTGICFGGEYVSRINALKISFDVQGLIYEYELIKNLRARDALVDYRAGNVASYLLETLEALDGESAETEKIAMEAIAWCKKGLSAEGLSPEEMTDTYYILAKMYDRLIRGAVSWIAYNADQQKYLKLCLASDPEHMGARLLSASKLLHLPESAGGNPVKGRALLFALQDEYPLDITIKIVLVQDFLKQKELAQAKAVLSEVIGLNPDHIIASRLLKEISVIEKEPVILNISLANQLKTSGNRVLNKLTPFIGSTYTFETKNAMGESLEQIRSIVGSSFTALEEGNGQVEIVVNVDENNMIMLGTMGLLELSLDYSRKIIPYGYPVLLYTDQNFLGSSATTRLIFAGPYVNFDYFYAGLIADEYLDIRLNWESLFLETDVAPIKDGRVQEDMLVKSPLHSVSLGMGKKFSAGFSAFLDTKVSYENWSLDPERTASGFTAPDYHLKYQPSFELSFSTMGEGTGSKLEAPSGFSLRLVPSLVYIHNYSAWGKAGELYAHDSKPQWMFSADFGFSKSLFPGHSLLLDAKYMSGGNMYMNNRWKTGKESLTSSGVSLDGYFLGEFSFDEGVLANVTYHFTAIPSTLSLFGRYAVFYNQDTREVFHGSALGIIWKLPFDMELTSRLGIGFNARRESGFGYEFDLMLSKLWFF